MFIILAYDVNKKRDQKVLKTCRKYLRHIQNSLFEGDITEKKLSELKKSLEKIIVKEVDGICIYKLESVKYASKEQIGHSVDNSNFI